jgi:uncharacterized membrane protein (UPF0127 family)/FixJ family two-component response regulator
MFSLKNEQKKKSNTYLLVIDDEKDFLTSVDFWFKSQGYQVETFISGTEALDFLKKKMPSVIFLNVQMPHGEGIETLRRIRELSIDVPVIMLSAFGSEEGMVEAYKLGVNGFFDKSSNFYQAQHLMNSLVRVISRKNASPAATPLLRKNNLLFLIILLAAVGLALFFMRPPASGRLCFKDKCLRVELAVTQKAREAGLMNRRSLGTGCGMLFVFPHEDLWPFWMKNTYIPLDILWMDKNGRVVDMVRNARPAILGQVPVVFTPVSRAKFALEANADFVEKNHIRVGDQASLK